MRTLKRIRSEIEFGGKKLILTSGDLADQSSGAVMAQYGETVVLATVVFSPLREKLGYFPLSVEYQERLYAGGKIKGSRWVKREGRPSDEEILIGRLIDRSIRPLFSKEFSDYEVQVTATVLSVDLENSPDIVAAVAASAAIEASLIPWSGPVSVIRLGIKDGKFLVNPTAIELESSNLDLVVSTTKDAVVMIEAGAKEVAEEKVIEGVELAIKEGKKLIDFISVFGKKVRSREKIILNSSDDNDFLGKVDKLAGKDIEEILVKLARKEMSYFELEQHKDYLATGNFEEEERQHFYDAFERLISLKFRKMVLAGKRPDGRKSDEIRPISVETSVLPRTHGSAIFRRGHTQVLSIATLGARSLEQLIETAEGEETKRYMHHYVMPPYSSGEIGKVGFPSRREIGHGALAERALMPVIPSEDVFPYTIRVVSEVLSSNGSTSMASTCGSTLALMDAGVPIKAPVSGIAMGLVIEDEKNFVVLTDIAGVEDGAGDMDFKVAGTRKGITALQLDVKTLKLVPSILSVALKQANKAREEILTKMLSAIPSPRKEISVYAPKIKIIRIPQSKIGELIGPGGRIIRALIAETGAQIDIEEDGTVSVSSVNSDSVEDAISKIEQLTKDVEVGKVYEGVVKRIESYGAFVEIFPGKEGMVHVSEMSREYVSDPRNIVRLGDRVQVRVKGIDEMGRVSLSMNLEGDDLQGKVSFERRTNWRNGRVNTLKERRKSEGPHFPASRLLEDFRGKKKY